MHVLHDNMEQTRWFLSRALPAIVCTRVGSFNLRVSVIQEFPNGLSYAVNV